MSQSRFLSLRAADSCQKNRNSSRNLHGQPGFVSDSPGFEGLALRVQVAELHDAALAAEGDCRPSGENARVLTQPTPS